MFTGDMKFINWRRVDLSKNDKRKRTGRQNAVWLYKSPIKKKFDGTTQYRRIVGISKHLLDEAGFCPGTELILVRSKDLFAFKKVGSKGQFKINSQNQIQNQPLYLELSCHTKINMFDAFVHEGMIVFHAPVDNEVDGMEEHEYEDER